MVSAVVRLGFSWTVRRDDTRAWREVMSMAGVVNSLLGANRVALTPAELVDHLSLHPLRSLSPEIFEDDPLGQVRVLERGEISDDIYTDGCSAIVELLEQGDRGRGWLPTWTWMQHELIERDAFLGLKAGGEAEYVTRRHFTIEHPAGEREAIADRCSDAGILPPVTYAPLPSDRTHEGRYWWPCPVCRWPMRVSGPSVRCSYRPHNAAYATRHLSDGSPPKLRPRDDTVRRQPAARTVHLDGGRQTVCVEFPVWRYIVVPGVEELRLYKKWADTPPLVVELWPRQDAYDVRFAIEELDWEWALDLKDVASASALADEVTRKPLAAKTIVLPDHRGTAQRDELRGLLPDYTVLMVEDVNRAVRKKLAEARKAR